MLTDTGKMCNVCYSNVFVECKTTIWRLCENFFRLSVLMTVRRGVTRGGSKWGDLPGWQCPRDGRMNVLKKLPALKRFSFFDSNKKT